MDNKMKLRSLKDKKNGCFNGILTNILNEAPIA
jgi:hypothetical protein